MTSSFGDPPNLDAVDLGLLDGVRELYEAIDPMPPDLVLLSCFAIDVEGPGFDVARLELEPVPAGTRGDERSRLITFDSPSGTIAVQIAVHADEHVRLDGWLTPPGEHRVELRASTGTMVAEVLPHGRFVFPRVPPGPVQIVVRLSGAGTIVTPAFVL
ncbi:hypothetical protein UK23_39260 [Lentzea aerocolonigenes]|uniref:Carboxypeptidase regulatory-like domain-containing protein n=1 Tax=Lentzea aerocolonigenes TaxID=68170 RepID=A0A0F0GF51_LENAE|nr:hypothetical protein [Lentzea aerocolonigenes]KJK42000.1 hypothetical protein UK23_39260 [Lentzea aerocolonigenes]